MTEVNVSEHECMQEIFLRCAHINVHIIACFRARKALDIFQVSQLSGEKSLVKRNRMVYEWIQSIKSFHDNFLWVMENNEQEHVSNLLKGIREGSRVPLSQSRYTRLESISPKLMIIIRSDVELVARLRARYAISEIDRQDILQVTKEYKRNWNLIEAILRRTDYAFDCFDQALRETLQDYAANYLHEGQVIAVHVTTTQPEKDKVLSQLLNETISNKSQDNQSSDENILTEVIECNINPVMTIPGQSIVFYFYCKTVDDVIRFTELFNSGDLQRMMEVIMNRLLSKSDPESTEELKAILSLDNAEVLAIEKFSGLDDWMPVALKEETSGSRIPYSAKMHTEHQLNAKDSVVDDRPIAEKKKQAYMSSVLSRATSHITDDGAGLMSAKIEEETTVSRILRNAETQTEPQHDDDNDDSCIDGNNKKYIDLKQKLEQSLKENDRLSKLLEEQRRKSSNEKEKLEQRQTEDKEQIKPPVYKRQEDRKEGCLAENKKLEEEQSHNKEQMKQPIDTKQKAKHQSDYDSDSFLLKKFRKKHGKNKNKIIQGLTVTDKELDLLLALREDSSEVYTYDFSSEWNLSVSNQLDDQESNNINNWFNVLDDEPLIQLSTEIWIVDPTSEK